MPSPAQHIHINNFTANLNFPPHPSPPTAAPQSLPPQHQQQQQQQQQQALQPQQPQSLHSQPLPFTIGSHFPPGTQYVAPFPQAPAPAQYQVNIFASNQNNCLPFMTKPDLTKILQGPPVVVYQPQPLHLAMFTPPPTSLQQGPAGQVQVVPNQGAAYHAPTPPPSSTTMVREGVGPITNPREGGGIMFGSTPVVSVRHSSSDEEEEQRTAHMRSQRQQEQKQGSTQKNQDEAAVRPQLAASDQVSFSPAHHSSPPGHQALNPTLGTVKPISGKANHVNSGPQSSAENQQNVNTAATKQTHHNQAEVTQAEPDKTNQSEADSGSQAPRKDSSTPPPSKSWASLFTPASGSGNSTPPTNKPTARIPPFSPHCSDPSTSAEGSEASEEDLRLSALLRNYQLNHMAPSFLPRGLTNRSNWCFVNAILQALLACPPFYNLMKALPLKTNTASNNKSTSPMIDSVVEFVNEFTPLEMMNKSQKKDKARKKEDLPTGNTLEPSYVYRTLLQLESETFKVIEGRQEDAEEFLTCMLNMISDEMSSLLKLTEVQERQEGGEENGEGGPEWQEVTTRGRSCITR